MIQAALTFLTAYLTRSKTSTMPLMLPGHLLMVLIGMGSKLQEDEAPGSGFALASMKRYGQDKREGEQQKDHDTRSDTTAASSKKDRQSRASTTRGKLSTQIAQNMLQQLQTPRGQRATVLQSSQDEPHFSLRSEKGIIPIQIRMNANKLMCGLTFPSQGQMEVAQHSVQMLARYKIHRMWQKSQKDSQKMTQEDMHT
jgi:hypothetical protein